MWNRCRNLQGHGGMGLEGINQSLKGAKARDDFRYSVIPGFIFIMVFFIMYYLTCPIYARAASRQPSTPIKPLFTQMS